MPQLVAACSSISLPPHTASAVDLARPRPTSLPVDAVHCPPDFPDSVQSRFLNADHSQTARLWAEMLGLWPWKAGQPNSYLSSHVIWLSLSDHWLSVCAGWNCWNCWESWESTCLECVVCSCRRCHLCRRLCRCMPSSQ